MGGRQEGVETLEKTAYCEFSEETGNNIDDSLALWKKEIDFRLPFRNYYWEKNI